MHMKVSSAKWRPFWLGEMSWNTSQDLFEEANVFKPNKDGCGLFY